MTPHNAFDRASCRATLGPLLAQVAWLRGYDLGQSTRLKLIPSCPASRVIGLGNSGLSAPDYFCPAIIGEKLEATDTRWLWMECYISYIFNGPGVAGAVLQSASLLIHYLIQSSFSS